MTDISQTFLGALASIVVAAVIGLTAWMFRHERKHTEGEGRFEDHDRSLQQHERRLCILEDQTSSQNTVISEMRSDMNWIKEGLRRIESKLDQMQR